jgi:phosphoglycerate kinase
MRFNFKTLDQVTDLRAKKVLVRVDFNVPIEGGVVVDNFRIERTLPTIRFLAKAGARSLLISHFENRESDSLLPVQKYLAAEFKVTLVSDLAAAEAALSAASAGDLILLENIRRFPGELANDPSFARKLAGLGEIFVNEAFSVSHRRQASVVGLPRFLPSYSGFCFTGEVRELARAFNPPKPFLLILGGFKFETKMPMVKRFFDKADWLFIAGAPANNFFKAEGFNVGRSSISAAELDLKDWLSNPKVVLPTDVLVLNDKAVSLKKPEAVSPADRIVDAGPGTLARLKSLINRAKFILWNGPLGEYEKDFSRGTEMVAKLVAEGKAESIIGGGDTLAAVAKLHLLHRFSFVSTGGGAMLDFLANETLPGIQALEESAAA